MTHRPGRRLRGWAVVAAAGAVLVAGGVGFALLRDDEGTVASDCAFVVGWNGRTWSDSFGTDRTPVAGDVLGEGVAPGCDDMGHGPGPSQTYLVRSVRGVDEREAILVGQRVLVPEGTTELPEPLRDGAAPVRCELDGSVRLVGRWTGVTSRSEARFDGDVRPPYRVDFRTRDEKVTRGWAEVGLVARGTTGSRPLSPAEVRAMLWDDGAEVLTTHCEDGRFVVDAIDPAG